MTTHKQAQPATSSTATNPSSAQSSSQNTSRALGRQTAASPLSLFENDFAVNPFTLMRRMQDEIERAFFGSSINQPGIRVPFTETFEKDGKYFVRAELPGLKEDEVKVEVNDSGIVIQGAHSDQKEEKQGEGYRTERQYSEFYRVVPLPEEAEVEQARADFQHGVLEIQIPLAQSQNRGRQIPVNASGSAQPEKKTAQSEKQEQAA